MTCSCCFSPGCSQCCTEWTLPGGSGDSPDEIQAAVSITAFQLCYFASYAVPGGNLLVYTADGTIGYSASLTLTRQAAQSGECGIWSYSSCVDNESVNCVVRLTYDAESNKCQWSASLTYATCIPEDCGLITSNPDNLCCDGTTYGFRAGVSFSSATGATGTVVDMTAACAVAQIDPATTARGGPFGSPLDWPDFCDRPGVSCQTACSQTNPLDCPVDIPATATITITV